GSETALRLGGGPGRRPGALARGRAAECTAAEPDILAALLAAAAIRRGGLDPGSRPALRSVWRCPELGPGRRSLARFFRGRLPAPAEPRSPLATGRHLADPRLG